MRYLLTFFALWSLPFLSLAYNPTINETTTPYEVLTIDGRIENKAEYLGQLTGSPHMYEFTLGAEAKLSLVVSQLENGDADPLRLALIVVKENTNNAGVKEVGRVNGMDWLQRKDGTLAMTFLDSQVYTEVLTPGTYRVEVSTPDNYGRYMLAVGDTAEASGYFKLLGDVHTIQSFFGLSIFAIFLSSAVYYPLGIMILIGLIYYTWRNKDKIRNPHA